MSLARSAIGIHEFGREAQGGNKDSTGALGPVFEKLCGGEATAKTSRAGPGLDGEAIFVCPRTDCVGLVRVLCAETHALRGIETKRLLCAPAAQLRFVSCETDRFVYVEVVRDFFRGRD